MVLASGGDVTDDVAFQRHQQDVVGRIWREAAEQNRRAALVASGYSRSRMAPIIVGLDG